MHFIAYPLLFSLKLNTKYSKIVCDLKTVRKMLFGLDRLTDRSTVTYIGKDGRPSGRLILWLGLCILCTSFGRPIGRPLTPAVDRQIDRLAQPKFLLGAGRPSGRPRAICNIFLQSPVDRAVNRAEMNCRSTGRSTEVLSKAHNGQFSNLSFLLTFPTGIFVFYGSNLFPDDLVSHSNRVYELPIYMGHVNRFETTISFNNF